MFFYQMSPEALLNCRRLPCRLNAEETAVLIGCLSHDIPILTRAGLIKPLGSPAANAVKYFSSVELQKKLDDDKWSAKVTNALYSHWRDQKAKTKPTE